MVARATALTLALPLLLAGCGGPQRPTDEPPDAGGPPDADAEPTPPRPDVEVLARFSLPGKAAAAVALARGACEEGSCAAVLQLVESGEDVDRQLLELPFGARDVERVELELLSIGAGDPLSRDAPPLEGWGGGSDDAPATWARVIKLSEELSGLLVHQAAGFEHLRRRHDLWVPVAGKLHRAWSHEEGTAPIVSSVDVIEQGAHDVVVLWMAFRSSEEVGGEPDRWSRTVYGWDPEASRLVAAETLGQGELPAIEPERSRVAGDHGVPLYAVVAATARSLERATKLREEGGECTAPFLVLSSADFPARIKASHLLALPTSRRDLAEAAAERLHECAPTLRPRILPLSE